MKILAFETATSACSVALLCAGEIQERFQIAPQRHAELILPMVAELLSQADLSLTQLDVIAFGRGPGSFMGARIAAGIAQGLAFGADLPVIPVSTLQVLAQSAHQQSGATDILAAWDARMQAIYWGAYRLGNDAIMLPIQADALCEPQDLVIPAGKTWVPAGNAWQVYQSALLSILADCENILLDIYPRASAIIRLAEVFYRQGQLHTAFEAEPVYLRDQVASVK